MILANDIPYLSILWFILYLFLGGRCIFWCLPLTKHLDQKKIIFDIKLHNAFMSNWCMWLCNWPVAWNQPQGHMTMIKLHMEEPTMVKKSKIPLKARKKNPLIILYSIIYIWSHVCIYNIILIHDNVLRD